MAKDPKEIVKQLVARVGEHDARVLLISEGLSTSIADKLVFNRYGEHRMQQLTKMAIERALEASKKVS